MRRILVLSLAGIVAAGAAVSTAPGAGRSPRVRVAAASTTASFRDAVLAGSRRLQGAERAGDWGGPTTASDGETVEIRVSDAYPVDPARTQSLADFVAQLYHGSELAEASFYVAPLAEVQQICGLSAGGCYDPEAETVVIPGESLPDGTAAETVLVHEYGHHVARNRTNAPWPAEDWGPKRWATAAGVCRREAAHTAYPGNESTNYPLNPGEAWAETYRLLNFDKQAWPSWTAFAPWNVDQSFYPDTVALDAAREDVLDPWTGPTVTTWSGRVAVAGRGVRRLIPTPLDGSMSVKLTRAPAGSQISVVDPATNAVVASGPRRASFRVCGQRSLVLAVRAKAPGAFGAIYATP